jgi:dihydrolipoamide dehydrogenase
MLPRLAPLEDEEVSAELTKAFTKKGIQCLPGHKVESVDLTNNGCGLRVSSDVQKKYSKQKQALLAMGFKPIAKTWG